MKKTHTTPSMLEVKASDVTAGSAGPLSENPREVYGPVVTGSNFYGQSNVSFSSSGGGSGGGGGGGGS